LKPGEDKKTYDRTKKKVEEEAGNSAENALFLNV